MFDGFYCHFRSNVRSIYLREYLCIDCRYQILDSQTKFDYHFIVVIVIGKLSGLWRCFVTYLLQCTYFWTHTCANGLSTLYDVALNRILQHFWPINVNIMAEMAVSRRFV